MAPHCRDLTYNSQNLAESQPPSKALRTAPELSAQWIAQELFPEGEVINPLFA